MLLVVEGLDRTGNTTLTTQLARDHGLEYVHYSKPEQHPLDEYCRPLEGPPPKRVVDRYHWGERVWPKIFNRASDFDEAMFHYTELALESRGAVEILTDRAADEIAEQCVEEGEPLQPEDVIRTAAEFNAVSSRTICPTATWHLLMGYLHPPEEDVLRLASERHSRAISAAQVTPRWIGHLQPNVLLVGDQVGPGSDGWSLPFVPYRSTSGHFLMQELLMVPDLWPAIVNSRTPEGSPENVAALWQRLGKPPIVALGKAAETLVRVTYLAKYTDTVPHPQWWRRFNRKAGAGSYGAVIQEAANV